MEGNLGKSRTDVNYKFFLKRYIYINYLLLSDVTFSIQLTGNLLPLNGIFVLKYFLGVDQLFIYINIYIKLIFSTLVGTKSYIYV